MQNLSNDIKIKIMNLIPRRVHATSIIMNDMFKNCKTEFLRNERNSFGSGYGSDLEDIEYFNIRINMSMSEILNEYWDEFYTDHLAHYRVFHDKRDNDSDDEDHSSYCDCCCKHWDDCQCFCSKCGDDYRACRYDCILIDG